MGRGDWFGNVRDGVLHGSIIKIDFNHSVSSRTSDVAIQLNILLL